MNLFRSEEHARNWSGFNPEFEELLQPLEYWVERFSEPRFRQRGAPDYIPSGRRGTFKRRNLQKFLHNQRQDMEIFDRHPEDAGVQILARLRRSMEFGFRRNDEYVTDALPNMRSPNNTKRAYMPIGPLGKIRS